MTIFKKVYFDLLRFIGIRYFFIFIILIVFMHVMQSLNRVGMPLESFISDQSIKNLLAKNHCFIPTSLKKIDWHDYKFIKYESKRKGLGEKGHAARLKNANNITLLNIYNEYGLNGLLSDNISLNRSLPDVRHAKCKKKIYIESLPLVSVIIPFHNEHLNTLLRTVSSVINRTPSQLVKEVLLIDDASTKISKSDLESYVAVNFSKVRVLRLAIHNGLIRAKLNGAKEATGDVLVFLESHSEVNVNWLPPLLEPIALNYRTVTCPLIDRIDDMTFKYTSDGNGHRGGFDSSFDYRQLPMLARTEQKLPEPFENPVMMGGLFAISRLFFWELGGYDPGLYIWGGEQYELSFKIWQCGGRMLNVPCSRVGHVFHKMQLFLKYGYGDFTRRNFRRVADVWMDEYAERIYQSNSVYSRLDPGDISEQKALRQMLQCKPFSWFISEVAFDLSLGKNNDVFSFPLAEGQVKPAWKKNICVEANYDIRRLFLTKCLAWKEGEQTFFFTWNNEVKTKDNNMCWDLPESNVRSSIRLHYCHGLGGNQLWRYDLETSHIIQGIANCLDRDIVSNDLYINRCDNSSITQQWEVDYGTYFLVE